jgi:hypothetical protein
MRSHAVATRGRSGQILRTLHGPFTVGPAIRTPLTIEDEGSSSFVGRIYAYKVITKPVKAIDLGGWRRHPMLAFSGRQH